MRRATPSPIALGGHGFTPIPAGTVGVPLLMNRLLDSIDPDPPAALAAIGQEAKP